MTSLGHIALSVADLRAAERVHHEHGELMFGDPYGDRWLEL